MQLLWTSKSQVLRLEEFSLYGKQSDEVTLVLFLLHCFCHVCSRYNDYVIDIYF